MIDRPSSTHLLLVFMALMSLGRPIARADDMVDLVIEDVTLNTYEFSRGDRVKIIATVNRGNMETPVRVRCYVDTGEVRQVASTGNLESGSSIEFGWTATFDSGDSIIIVGAYVEPYAGERDTGNNGLWRVYHSPDEADSASNPSLDYAVITHEHLTAEAIKLANIPEVSAHAERIVAGAKLEDNFPDLVYGVSWFFGVSTLWTRHFWDVDAGEAGSGLWGRESALAKGRAYLFGWGNGNHPGAYALYQNGETELAYEYLGRCLHFIEDCSTPAHVHLDAHAIDDDEAEKWGSHHAYSYTYEMTTPFDGDTFYNIIEHAAQLADSLPSDDMEGDTVGFVDPGGWTPILKRTDIISWNAFGWDKVKPEGMKKLFDRTMPSAIAHAAGMIRLFWKTTHPGEELPPPATGTPPAILKTR